MNNERKVTRARKYICPKCGHESEERRVQIQIRAYENGKYTVSESFSMDTLVSPKVLKEEIIQSLLRVSKGGDKHE